VAATPALAANHPAHVVVPDGFCGPSDLRITALNAEKPWVSPGGPAEAWRRLLCAWVLVCAPGRHHGDAACPLAGVLPSWVVPTTRQTL